MYGSFNIPAFFLLTLLSWALARVKTALGLSPKSNGLARAPVNTTSNSMAVRYFPPHLDHIQPEKADDLVIDLSMSPNPALFSVDAEKIDEISSESETLPSSSRQIDPIVDLECEKADDLGIDQSQGQDKGEITSVPSQYFTLTSPNLKSAFFSGRSVVKDLFAPNAAAGTAIDILFSLNISTTHKSQTSSVASEATSSVASRLQSQSTAGTGLHNPPAVQLEKVSVTPSVDATPEVQPFFNPFPTATSFEPALQFAAQPDFEPTTPVFYLAFANTGYKSASQFGQTTFDGSVLVSKNGAVHETLKPLTRKQASVQKATAKSFSGDSTTAPQSSILQRSR